MSTRRLAVVIAVFGLGAAVLAGIAVAYLLSRSSADNSRLLFLILIPIALGAVEAVAVGRAAPSVSVIWAATGGVCGFVVLAAFSLGPWFAIEALAFLAAACVRLVDIRPGWKLATAPLWLVAGASAWCPLLWGLAWWQTSRTGTVQQHARGYSFRRSVRVVHPTPVLPFGTGVFALIVLLLAGAYVLGRHLSPVQSEK